MLAGAAVDEFSVGSNVVLGSLHVVVEVDGYFEERAELLVVYGQEIVEPALANEDDLDVERDRLRLQCCRRGESQCVGRCLDANLPRKQCLLQRVPGKRTTEHAVHVEHEKTAVGLQQRTAAHHAEIRQECAHFGPAA